MADLQFVLTTAISILAEVIVLIVIAARGRGRARIVGLVGAVLLLLGAIGSVVISAAAPYLFQQLRLPFSLYPVVLLPVTLLHGVGVIVVAVAIGTHSREARSAANQPPSRSLPPLSPR